MPWKSSGSENENKTGIRETLPIFPEDLLFPGKSCVTI